MLKPTRFPLLASDWMSTTVFQQLYRSMRSKAREVLVRSTFVPMERFAPVDRHLWCFCTWGRYFHTLDNPRAVFEKVKDDPSITKVVLTRDAPPEGFDDGVNVHFVEPESLLGMYYVSRAGVILLGYRVASMCSYSQHLTTKHLIVQLWHGIPLKRIGRLFPGEEGWQAETSRYAATVSSSERDHSVMEEAFAPLPRDQVWITGLPRNDFIIGDEATLPTDYQGILGELRARIGGRKFVLYAPTWREGEDSHYSFSTDEAAALEQLLTAHNAVLGIRGHSNVREHAAYTGNYGSSVFLNVNDIPDVNVALRITDVLVTDYSSIYIDFLLTQRPVIHFTYDLEAYREERGFLYDVEDAFAGPSADTFPELLSYLEQALSNPTAASVQRDQATALFHSHARNSAQETTDRIRQLLAPRRRDVRQAALPAEKR